MLNGKLLTIIERCEFDFEYLNRTLLCLFLLCLSPSLICKIHILNSWDELWCLVTVNRISALSWRSILLVEETGVSGENNRSVTF